MAQRPIFIPSLEGYPYAKEVKLEFEWYAGFSKKQVQRSIGSLHEAASKKGITPVLEISSKSPDPIGVSLSAFNLRLRMLNNPEMPVECAFQGSKVFEHGGPYTDLYRATSRDAKTDERIRSSGVLIGFRFLNEEFPLQPATAFYDWLYLNALWQNPDLSSKLTRYNGFTDIAFNPDKSLNCQARSAALFVALKHTGLL